MHPQVSIIITCFNLGAYLQEALDSIGLYPHPEHCEVIIVDDGSTDTDTIAMVSGLDPERYKVIRQPNQGLGAARNNGIRAAQAPTIIPLDADNRLHPVFIARTIEQLAPDSGVDVVYGDAIFIGDKSGPWKPGPPDISRLLVGNHIDACAGFRRSLWERMGGYDERMPVMGYEDWDLWLRCTVAGAVFRYFEEPFFDYRVRGDSMITQAKRKLEAVTAYIFDKPELRFLREHRTTFIDLLNLSRQKKVDLDGRTLLRLLLGRLKERIVASTSNAGNGC